MCCLGHNVERLLTPVVSGAVNGDVEQMLDSFRPYPTGPKLEFTINVEVLQVHICARRCYKMSIWGHFGHLFGTWEGSRLKGEVRTHDATSKLGIASSSAGQLYGLMGASKRPVSNL